MLLPIRDDLTQSYLRRKNTHRTGPVFASTWNDSPEWRLFLDRLCCEANDAMPASTDPGATNEMAVPSDFTELYSLSGYVPSTKGFPMVGNSILREQLGLCSSWSSEADRSLFRALAQLMFRRVALIPYRLNRKSSTMYPHWTVEPAARVSHLNEMFTRVRDIQRLCSDRDVAGLWNLGLVDVASTVSRLQPDRLRREGTGFVPKERLVPSEKFGLTAGRKGDLCIMDKSTEWPRFYTMRERQAYGMSGMLNAFVQSAFAAWRADYLKRFEFAFCQKGLLDVSSKVVSFESSVACDATQFDSTLPVWMFDEFVDTLPCNDWFRWLVRRVGTSDVLYSACVRGEKSGGFTAGHHPVPRNEERDDWGGLLSGVCFVSDFGKLVGTFVAVKMLAVVCDFVVSAAELPLFLRGDLDYALLCAGDNLMFLGPEDGIQKLQQALVSQKLRQQYIGLSLERDFCGYVLSKQHRLTVFPNVVSYVVNPFAKEHLITSPRASNWRLGYVLRQQVFAPAPCYPVAREVIARTYRDVFKHPIEVDVGALDVPTTLSAADMMYTLKPDVIHYLISEHDVSSELLDLESVVVTPPTELDQLIFK